MSQQSNLKIALKIVFTLAIIIQIQLWVITRVMEIVVMEQLEQLPFF